MRAGSLKRALGVAAALLAAGPALAASPAPFTFAERTGVATRAVVTSEAKTLTGFSEPLPVSITTADGAQYSIAGGAYTNAPGTIAPGQALRVRHVSAASASTPVVTTVTVGDYGTQFRSVTGTADRSPEPFTFGMQAGVEPATRIESASVLPAGFNVGVAVVPGVGAEYRIDSGPWTAAAGTLAPGQRIAARHVSSAQFLGYTRSSVKVGDVTAEFTTRTREQNPPPPPPPPDADGDGVSDANDQCDDEPGAAGNDGCPVDAATGFPVCDPSPLEAGCLADLDEFFPVPVGSALQGAIDTVYAAVAGNAGLSRHVDPRIGSYPPGFTNPGPVAPFGMVALGPDTEGPLAYGGYYQHNALVTGFSHVHMSAGVYKGGYFPALPFTGELTHAPFDVTQGASQPIPGYASAADDATEVAEAGYYAVRLARYGALAELTATERVGLHRYTFSDPAQPGRVLIDLSRSLGGYDAAGVTLSADGTLLTGTVHTGDAGGFDIWFAARLSEPFTVSTFAGSALLAGQSAAGDDLGVVLDFPGAPARVLMKVALSYTDQAGAIANLAEMPSWKFDTVRAQTRRKWDRALARIEVEGGADADLTSFYTALYRLHHFPNLHSDVDGRYRGPDRNVHADTRPHYSQFSSWDSYRGQNQLQAEIFPDIYKDMVRSLLAFHEQGGALPRWQQGPRDASHMSGDPVVPFVGEAWCRGALEEDLRAQLWPALTNLPARRDPELAQRGYLSVEPADLARQVEGGSGRAGTTLEYGIADFSLALMAQSDPALGGADAAAIAQRSLNYRNLLDPETGWIRPRHADGSWLTPFAPELGYGFQEGTSWQYSWLAMHDYAGVIERMGGDATVDRRLDVFFNFPVVATTPAAWPTVQNQATAFGVAYYGNQYAPGNEHDLEAPYVYHYAGAPWKSQAVARAAASIYTPTPNGLPGNDDLGALSGWLLWTMSGLYPMNPGAPLAVVGSPVFEKVTLRRPGGDLVIEAPGASATNKYVQSVELDGVAQERSWLLLPRSAATIRLAMGPAPNAAFGVAKGARPPSLSTHGLDAFGCTVEPQADADADTVADGDDQCPGEAGLPNLHGCPLPPQPEPPGQVESSGVLGLLGELLSDLGNALLAALEGDASAAADHGSAALEHAGDNASEAANDPLDAGNAVAPEQGNCAPDNGRAAGYGTFVGSLHEHSGYSDGAVGTTPADYFAQGAAQGLDFMGATEHSDNARAPVTANAACLSPDLAECLAPLPSPDQPAAPLTKWELTLAQARAATTAEFTAFRGFEWTSDRFGHINVLFSRHDWNAKTTEGYTASMESFWRWFTTRPELGGGADGLAVFNHPGREDQIEAQVPNADPAYAFNDFAYRPEADLRMVGIETFGKGGDAYDTDNNAPAGGWYAYALDRGWHVGPVGAEDEHGTAWGRPSRAKTLLLARDRSAGALREALFARRFYAVSQGHNDIRLAFTGDGQPMGSRLARAEGAAVTLSGAVTAGAAVHHVDLVTRGGAVLATQVGRSVSATVAATGDERWYYLRAVREDGRPIAYSAPIWIRAGGAYPVCGEWIAGDFHVHSTYSHDSWGGPDDDNTGPDEAYTAGHTVERQFQVAAARGLDYLAITDHNDVRSQSDAGFGAFGVVPVRSYENSLSGHAQMHGAGRIYDAGDKSAAAINAMADALRADGGVFQVNHPFDGPGTYPDNAGWRYGTAVVPDTIEVWNIGPRFWQKPFPANTNNDDSTRWWESWLDAGYRVAATGGSDNHWVATTAVQGNGQPTTWLFVTERSEHGVLDALRAGRTAISHQPPLLKGARLVLEADADGDGLYEAITGATVPDSAALRVRAFDGQGTLLRVMTDGGRLLHGPVTVGTPVFEYRFTAPRSTWVRAELAVEDIRDERQALDAQCDGTGVLSDNGFPEDTHTTYCRNQLLVTAMSSALYLGAPTPAPPPAPAAVTVTSTAERVELRSGLVERTWSRRPFRTERLVDARTGKVWSQDSADFTLVIDGAELPSDRFEVVGEPRVEHLANGAARTTFTLAPVGAVPVGLTLTRVVEMYPDVAGMRSETWIHSAVPLALSGYSLDESRPQGAGLRGTIHSFRAGADWREPEWTGPQVTIGDAHAGDWRETQVGADVSGSAQWLSVNDAQDARLFYVLERNDYASSMMSLAGGRARAHVDLARDVIYLGPLEEAGHAENPGPGPARHRVVMPGAPLRLEPVFTGLGTSGDDEPWQHHKYLARYRMPPYRREVTFNSNGVDSNRISTGAKDDMDFAETQRQAAIASELGVETFILDDGWQARSGDWCPDSVSTDPACQEPRHTEDPSDPKFQPRFPDSDFTAVRALLAPSGMNLGLWMTPLHFNPSAVVFEQNPQWACQPISAALLAAHQADPYGSSNEAGILQWNLEATGPDGKAVDYIEGRIRRAIVDWQVRYFKFDFTVWLDCAGVAPADIYMYRESFMAMLDRILADHPDVTIQMDETNDYRLFPFEAIARGPTWYQNGSPTTSEALHANHVLAPWIPLHALGRNALRAGDLPGVSVDYQMAVALLSHITFFNDLTRIPAPARPQVRAWTEYYKAHRADLAQLTYPLLAEDPLDEGTWAAFQAWDPEAGRGALLVYRQDSPEATRVIRLRNVPDGTYRLFEAPHDQPVGAVTAAKLREGLSITLPAPRSARVLRIERITG